MKKLEEGKTYTSTLELDNRECVNDFLVLRNTQDNCVFCVYDAHNEDYNERLKEFTSDELMAGHPYLENEDSDYDFANYAEELIVVYEYKTDHLTTCLGYKITNIKPLDN